MYVTHLSFWNVSLSLFPLISFVQFSCSAVSTLCDPIDCSMPGFLVHHQLPKLAFSLIPRKKLAVFPFRHTQQAKDSFLLPSPSPPLYKLNCYPSIIIYYLHLDFRDKISLDEKDPSTVSEWLSISVFTRNNYNEWILSPFYKPAYK